MTWKVELNRDHVKWGIHASADLANALAKIIELNYNYAEEKYGDGKRVESYDCIKVAKKALTDNGYVIVYHHPK